MKKFEDFDHYFGIYLIRDSKGDLVYIGSTAVSFNYRWRAHLDSDLQKNYRLREVLENGGTFHIGHGWFPSVKRKMTLEDLLRREAELIYELKPRLNQQFIGRTYDEQVEWELSVGRISVQEVERRAELIDKRPVRKYS